MREKTESETGKLVSYYVGMIALWGPIACGIIHQIAMYIGRERPDPERFDRIPVFVNPPGDIGPFVTLEYQWWLVLMLVTSSVFLLIQLRRQSAIPKRVAVPFYIYLLFLLIFVKPI